MSLDHILVVDADGHVSEGEAADLGLAPKERILGRNAVEFFRLANLPAPNALRLASRGWSRAEGPAVAARP